MDKVIGIIGGMGPEATVDLFRKIIKATPAQFDQQHLRVVIDSNCKIPDRVKAIFEKGEDPAPAMIETAKNLERAGVELLILACNAAHYYYEKIVQNVSIPVLHIMEETATYCNRRFPHVKIYGLLAGSSTVELALYPKAFERIQKKILDPKPEDQEKLLRSIYKIKTGDLGSSVKAELLVVAQNLHAARAEVIILGCTEIPLVLKDGDMPFPFIDPTQILAEAAVNIAKGWPKEESLEKL